MLFPHYNNDPSSGVAFMKKWPVPFFIIKNTRKKLEFCGGDWRIQRNISL
jgi:DNA modification methylase